MLISWLNKLSLIDYPGHVACVVFTLGCNLRCGYCHNPDFVLPERISRLKISRESEKDFLEFLKTRQWLLEGVSICWGEPTIHRDLWEFCAKIKTLWFKIKLDTNGRYPEVLEALIRSNLVDYIAMDIKHTWEKYYILTGVVEDMTPYQRSVSIIKESAPAYEFRTTLIGGIHTPDDIEWIGDIISDAKSYSLQRYRRGETLDPGFAWYSPPDSMLYDWRDALESHYLGSVQIRF